MPSKPSMSGSACRQTFSCCSLNYPIDQLQFIWDVHLSSLVSTICWYNKPIFTSTECQQQASTDLIAVKPGCLAEHAHAVCGCTLHIVMLLLVAVLSKLTFDIFNQVLWESTSLGLCHVVKLKQLRMRSFKAIIAYSLLNFQDSTNHRDKGPADGLAGGSFLSLVFFAAWRFVPCMLFCRASVPFNVCRCGLRSRVYTARTDQNRKNYSSFLAS